MSVNRSTRLMAIASFLLVAVAAAGCGSSSNSTSSSTTSATAISRGDFVAQANAICSKGNKVTDAAGAKLGNSPTKAQVSSLVSNTFVPNIQGQIDGIKALGAPSGDEAAVSHMLSLAQADLDKLKADPTALVTDNTLFADFAKVAHPYGLTSCAAGS
jgi:hypothetical protein